MAKRRADSDRKWFAILAVTATAAAVLFYGEFLCYFLSYLSWPDPSLETTHFRLLLVADPQLVGLRGEPPWPLGAVTRWDLDRYLGATFRWAMSYLGRVDAVVFLGDLLDEGSETADEAVYAGYASRFRRIYSVDPGSGVKIVHVGGDNDVGGEGLDEVTREKIRRFRTFFPEEKVTRLEKGKKSLNVVSHNKITREFDDGADDDADKAREADSAVVVSHLPVIADFYSPSFRDAAFEKYSPSVVFSAHTHVGALMSIDRSGLGASTFNVSRTEFFPGEDDQFLFDLDSPLLYEVLVPACSYRTGHRKMSLGVADFALNTDSRLASYRNLWMPDRRGILNLYLAVLAASLTFVACCCCRGGGSRRARGGRCCCRVIDKF